MTSNVEIKTDRRPHVRAARLRALPPYLFIEIDHKKRERIAAGKDIIDLGVGDPDRPTPSFIIDALDKAARDATNHRYPFDAGSPEFHKAAAAFLARRFDITIEEPKKHLLTCIGSKDGIAHLPIAVVNPGDTVLLGNISYPVYRSGAIFAGANVHEMEMNENNGWIPDLSEIPGDVARNARLMWINYPNNPTAAVAPLSFFEDAVRFCAENDIILASDNAYSEVYFDEHPPSMWQATAAGANLKNFLGIEFHSLSKTFNMTGWRIAFAVGHPDVISALGAVKGNCDSGQFNAIQEAGAVALNHTDHVEVRSMLDVYRERRDAFCDGMNAIGCTVPKPAASFFVWGRCPGGWESFDFCTKCLEEADVVLVPGGGFSETSGKHYFRAAMTVEVERINEAIKRLQKIDWNR